MTTYFRREIARRITEALDDMPVVVITGMRQTGKSTFLQNEPKIKKRRYITLDDFAQFQSAREDPDGFIESDGPLTIDEAQKCPELLTAIKKRVDKKRQAGQFLLSGSANFAMLKGISESLAGRAVYFTMHSFTRREIRKRISKKPFLYNFFRSLKTDRSVTAEPIKTDEIITGGMPIVCLGQIKNRSLWFKGFEQTYLERDIREISQIGNIIPFRQLLHLIAHRTGQLLSPSQLGRDVKLNAATTSRYLSILEASFVMYRIAPFLKNRSSRLIKSPKLYMSDSGLASYLTGIDRYSLESLRGPMLETYVAQNLLGVIESTWPEADLYFWHVQGRHEVDFVIEDHNKCMALEVKAGVRWDDRDLSGLRNFLSTTPQCVAGILAYNGREIAKIGKNLWAIPLSVLLS